MIQNCITLIRHQVERSAELHLELQEVPTVFAHPTQVGQVIMNLVVNAAHAMDGMGTILITTVGTEEHVHIVVEDNGSGIPEDKLWRIFDPFFTTKGVGEGSGLGLSMVYGFPSSPAVTCASKASPAGGRRSSSTCRGRKRAIR